MQDPTYAMSNRSLEDRPDDYQGAQVHVIYAVPKGGVDRQFDLANKIPYSLAAMNNWLQGQIGRKVKLDTYKGDIDITFVQLPRTDAEYASSTGTDKAFAIRSDMARFETAGKNLLVFYDGPGTSTSCGESTIPFSGSQRFDVQFSLVYGEGCWIHPSTPTAPTPTSTPSFSDNIAMHEMFHAFGALHPPQVTSAQTLELTQQEVLSIECDLMYVIFQNLCVAGKYLDPARRFYYNPAGFTDGRVNTYDSLFLTRP
ncbi:MAG: hypothetical protein ACXVCX_11315 [Ktedonobacterales bacterium]